VELEDPAAYHRLLAKLWSEGIGFLNIEHDVAIHSEVIPQLEACPEPWCLFPYSGGTALLYEGLGCVRFSTKLLRALPDVVATLDCTMWWQLDYNLAGRLRAAGYAPHVHEPPVGHFHRWQQLAHHGTDCECPTCKFAKEAHP
jgi:hypothetical protein